MPPRKSPQRPITSDHPRHAETQAAYMDADDANPESVIKRAKITAQLPAPLAREIGHVIVAHASLENSLSILVLLLLDVPSAFGRLAVREPRATDRFELARQLIELHGLKFSSDEIRDIGNEIAAVNAQRDQLAHGIWIEAPTGELHLRLTRGSWQPVQGQRGKTKREVLPEAMLYDVAMCRTLRDRIRRLLPRIYQFAGKVEKALATSPYKHDVQFHTVDRALGRTPKKLPPPLRSSRR